MEDWTLFDPLRPAVTGARSKIVLRLDHVVDRFTYDPETGAVTHKGTGMDAVLRNFTLRPRVKFVGMWVNAAQLGWLLHTGRWARRGLVHLNGDLGDIRAKNLQEIPERGRRGIDDLV